MMKSAQYIKKNIQLMNELEGYDIIIICTSTIEQEEYWQKRLTDSRGSISPLNSKIVAVHEDWNGNGGAGNGLGTLYAYEKAVVKAKALYSMDISQLLEKNEISVALYHTAGKGTRLAPLPGSENNNKSGVKLPAMVTMNGEKYPMTILEAVIKQTGVYAKSRYGRLSVFWGDQIFIASCDVEYVAQHHIDILATLAPLPTEEEWIQKGLEKYGIIAVNHQNDAAQLEKVSYSTATRLLKSFGQLKSVGTSLGSFSVDHHILKAFLYEFQEELKLKQGKFDTDPHFWMPLTLQLEAYLEVMAQKGVAIEEAEKHYQRMKNMYTRFRKEHDPMMKPLFGCVDIGDSALWWDYGQLKLYLKNSILLTQDTQEAEYLRLFLGIQSRLEDSCISNDNVVDSSSCVLGSTIPSGNITKSVLTNVHCDEVHVSDCVMVNVTARSIRAKNCVIYNVATTEVGLHLEDGTVLAGVYLPNGEKCILRSKLGICGGTAWKNIVEENLFSFEQIYNINAQADITQLEKICLLEHEKAKRGMATRVPSAFRNDNGVINNTNSLEVAPCG